jgi:hypothetical protein
MENLVEVWKLFTFKVGPFKSILFFITTVGPFMFITLSLSKKDSSFALLKIMVSINNARVVSASVIRK